MVKEQQIVVNSRIVEWRTEHKPDKELMADIKARGQLQPIIARKLKDGKLEIMAGNRRYAALTALGQKPELKVLENISDVEAVLIALAENRHRKDLTPIEEARAYETLVKLKVKVSEIAERVSRSDNYVKERLALLDLPQTIQNQINEGKLPLSHAKSLAKLKAHPEAQEQIATQLRRQTWQGDNIDRLVTETEEELKRKEILLKKYGPCPKCNSPNIDLKETWSNKHHLRCEKCKYEWHAVTKDPWALYEIKEHAEKIGLKAEIQTDNEIALQPKDIQKIVEERTEAIKAIEEPEPTIRAHATPAEMLMKLISDNVQTIHVDGEKINLELTEDSHLHFSAFKKDYLTGEKAKVVVKAGWQGKSETVAIRKPIVEEFLKNFEVEGRK